MSISTMWRVLWRLSFRYKKRSNKRKLYEKPAILASRANFLRGVREVRQQGRPLVYLDETWCNQHHSLSRAWMDEASAPDDVPSGKGKRIIILHAGWKEGWVPDAELVFVGSKKSGDYHDEMNAQHFEE